MSPDLGPGTSRVPALLSALDRLLAGVDAAVAAGDGPTHLLLDRSAAFLYVGCEYRNEVDAGVYGRVETPADDLFDMERYRGWVVVAHWGPLGPDGDEAVVHLYDDGKLEVSLDPSARPWGSVRTWVAPPDLSPAQVEVYLALRSDGTPPDAARSAALLLA